MANQKFVKMNNPFVEQFNHDSQLAAKEGEAQALREKVNDLQYELERALKTAEKNWNVAEYYRAHCKQLQEQNDKLKQFIEKNETPET